MLLAVAELPDKAKVMIDNYEPVTSSVDDPVANGIIALQLLSSKIPYAE